MHFTWTRVEASCHWRKLKIYLHMKDLLDVSPTTSHLIQVSFPHETSWKLKWSISRHLCKMYFIDFTTGAALHRYSYAFKNNTVFCIRCVLCCVDISVFHCLLKWDQDKSFQNFFHLYCDLFYEDGTGCLIFTSLL